MPRNRVLSFISQWRAHSPDPNASTTAPSRKNGENGRPVSPIDTATARSPANNFESIERQSPAPRSPGTPSRARAESRTGNRPLSMIQTYQPPYVDAYHDTPPELQPIFGYLNSHGNKLYQEGYFLKLHDLDARGRPSADRTWVECFAQLVGTVLSHWDAAALDAAGVDGEVVPTFINLSDASLKMIESLPMSGAQGGKLQNVLSVSTAANNRYLFHFNSLNSLTQWTAGIRLAMFEHATLQEAYTGSLIAGKGRYLNNIRPIMERSRFPTEDWARVRFGAGTPWRRLWFVITPPDEKEYHKVKKSLNKGASYLRSQLPRGDIKFYESRKVTKKTKPIATINDVYAAYAIYPQSKPLIEQSTLVKMEGLVTIHGSPETTAEGFVFIMPEVHPAISGFEMMLRWLFPVWDTFNLYGRPTKLIADTLDQRGLMFAMPTNRRYGYLDTLDVSGLIHEDGSPTWSERQWRKQMKKLTAERMANQLEGPGIYGHRRSNTGSQASLPNVGRQGVRFGDAASMHESRSASPAPEFAPPKRTDSAPPGQQLPSPHKRSASDAQGYKRYQTETPSRLSQEANRGNDYGPPPPRHGMSTGPGALQRIQSGLETPTMASIEAGMHPTTDAVDVPPAPINSPPAFTHNPNSRPAISPAVAPELRRAHSGVDALTLAQMKDSAQPSEGTDGEYGNLVANTVDENTYLNSGGSHADRSQGPPSTRGGAIRTLPGQQPLSAIPASPRGNDDFSTIDERMRPAGIAHPLPPVPPEQDSRPLMPSSRSSQSISRKPVQRKAVGGATPSTSTPSSEHENGSFRNAYIDNDALERVLQEDARTDSMGSVYAGTTGASSMQGKQQSSEQPRMGRMKTVGDPELAPNGNRTGRLDSRQAASADIPAVDFGPTMSYKPTGRADTGKTIAQDNIGRSQSRNRLSSYLPGANRTSTGTTSRRFSWFGSTGNTAAKSPQAGDRNSVAWAPSAAAENTGAGATLTPEQWVQYRAAMASLPQAAPRSSAPAVSHERQEPASKASRKLTKTPTLFNRKSSGDWSRQTPTSQSESRRASAYFGQPSPASPMPVMPQHEQTHAARATGSPFFNASSNQRQIQANSTPNLLGAMDMREREKVAVKDGMRNGLVDEAARARQQQQQQQQQNNAEALRQHAMATQQQNQQSQQAVQAAQAAQAYHHQQQAHIRSAMSSNASPLQHPAHRQSRIPPQANQQQMPPQPAYNTRNGGLDHQQGHTSPFAQRLYEGQQSQAFMAQQGQQQMGRQSPGQGYTRQ